jgi:cytochrome bd-type quinol oxidase subunit 2
MEQKASPQQERIVWWFLWASFQIGIVFIYVFLGEKGPSTAANEPTLWQLGFLPVLISGAIRWSFLPTFKEGAKAFPFFIMGISLAEMSCFLGIFIFPSHQKHLFVASFIGILQFIPIYFDRYFGSNPDQPGQ